LCTFVVGNGGSAAQVTGENFYILSRDATLEA